MRNAHALLVLAILGLSGCSLVATNSAALREPFVLDDLSKQITTARVPGAATGGLNSAADPAGEQAQRSTGFYQTPKLPQPARNAAGSPPPPAPVADAKNDVTSAVALENMPLPQFINAIYGVVLKKNVSVDPAIAQRTELVSLRTGKPQSASQLADAAQAVLRSYGIAVNEFQGLVRVVPENSQAGYLPEIRRGRAHPDVPASLRPVFYLAELEHTPVSNLVNWLRTLFPNRLNVQDDGLRNAVLLSGQSDVVSAAMEAIQLLDQPLLRGRLSARITPVFWSADEMARRLVDVLTAEGYSAGTVASGQTPILVLPVGPVNSVIVFAANEQILNHTLRWARDLDQSPQGRSGNFITYYVRNTDATDLAKTLSEVMGGPSAVPTAGAGAGGAPAAAAGNKKVVVNAAANSLIIQTTPAEYQQWYGLLQELDRPARSALIMATVAEVRLTDTEQFGFNWLLKQFVSHGVKVNTTIGAKTPATGTFNLQLHTLAGDPRAVLTALASSNRIRILSNPSIVALNGQTATIQVGQEVPILTSQISNANTGTSTGGILQTIQYRNTGVILKVKPVIHAGGRIDLEVGQEVSAAQKNETGVDSSPIILTRRVDTRLSLTDGATTLLGGLISETRTTGDAGLPMLKDIPYAGALFRTDTSGTTERTELVVLLTPHVMSDDFEARAVTDAFRSQFGWASGLSSPVIKQSVTPASAAREEGAAAINATSSTTSPDAAASGAGDPKGGAANASAGSVAASAKAPVSRKQEAPKTGAVPYIVPEKDAPTLTLSTSVAQPQQPAQEMRPLVTQGATTQAPDVANSRNRSQEPVMQGAKPVADEKLRKELLDAITGGR